MDVYVYGYIIVMLAFALVIALAYLGAILIQNKELKSRNDYHKSNVCGYLNALGVRQKKINEAAADNKKLHAQIERLTEELRIAKEEVDYVNETLREQEDLIKQKDEELAYNEQYMASQQHVLELSQKEIDDLHRKLKAADSPSYLKACLLEKIQECGNLKHLNELLETANASYAADLKQIKSEFQEMMQRVSATEFAQIRTGEIDPDAELKQNEYRPDLGPENCTSQEPQIPADSIDANQVSACI